MKKYLMPFLYGLLVFLVAFQTGIIFEYHDRYKRTDACWKRVFKLQSKKDLYYEFYGVPIKYRRTRIKLGYNHIAAFSDYQISQCLSGQKMYGEE